MTPKLREEVKSVYTKCLETQEQIDDLRERGDGLEGDVLEIGR